MYLIKGIFRLFVGFVVLSLVLKLVVGVLFVGSALLLLAVKLTLVGWVGYYLYNRFRALPQ